MTSDEALAFDSFEDALRFSVEQHGMVTIMTEQSGTLTPNNADRADSLAQAFHEAHERLAPQYGFREESAVDWDNVPAGDKGLMRAVAQYLIRAGFVDQAEKVSPQTPGTITGYREHTQNNIDLVNMIKQRENTMGQLIADMRAGEVDGKMVAVDDDLARRAAETFQVAYMLLVRSVFQPESNLKP